MAALYSAAVLILLRPRRQVARVGCGGGGQCVGGGGRRRGRGGGGGDGRFSVLLFSPRTLSVSDCLHLFPQWGAADAETKVPSVENTKLKSFPFETWSRSVHSHTCYA